MFRSTLQGTKTWPTRPTGTQNPDPIFPALSRSVRLTAGLGTPSPLGCSGNKFDLQCAANSGRISLQRRYGRGMLSLSGELDFVVWRLPRLLDKGVEYDYALSDEEAVERSTNTRPAARP